MDKKFLIGEYVLHVWYVVMWEFRMC